MLYHGTIIEGLKVIRANSKSHSRGGNAAYFTEDRCYALICCREPQNNFVTMGLKDDGRQHYYERFPEQLKVLYGGKRGYLYWLESADGLINTNGHTWESRTDVPVQRCEVIDDVFAEILREEEKGSIVIHRYSEIDPTEQKMHANYIKAHLSDEGEDMKRFYLSYFSNLWD